jgi:HSP20 family protein
MNAVSNTQNQQPHQQQEQNKHGFVVPPANISEAQNEYLLELDMPGVNKDGLHVTVENNELTIIGRRQMDAPAGELCYCESGLADYRRVFELGPDIDTTKIRAEIKSGVLKLHLPKSERAKPKRIEVQLAE